MKLEYIGLRFVVDNGSLEFHRTKGGTITGHWKAFGRDGYHNTGDLNSADPAEKQKETLAHYAGVSVEDIDRAMFALNATSLQLL